MMRKKILKGFLVATCQLVLVTSICFASEVNEKYFTPKPFKMVSTWVDDVKGKGVNESLNEIQRLYEEAYNLEKEMKYFNADKKWDEVTDLADEAMEILEEYYEEHEDDEDDDDFREIEEAIDDFVDDVNQYSQSRDYRYGFLTFDKAYELELKDFIALMPENKREAFKVLVEGKYKEMEATYTKLLNLMEYRDIDIIKDSKKIQSNVKKYEEYKKLKLEFEQERNALNLLIKSAYNKKEQQYLFYTKNDIYNTKSVYLDSEKFNRFLNEEEVIDVIGNKNIEKLKKLTKEVQKVDNDIDRDDYLDEIEEMLLDYFPKHKEYYKGRNNKNLEKIRELYNEMDDDDDDEDDD
jgi:hypothetical protein